MIDSDITTLSGTAADKVIRVGEGAEPLSRQHRAPVQPRDNAGTHTMVPPVALDYRHDLPVLTVLVLLPQGGEFSQPHRAL